jgi:hypothetical protein
MTHETLNGTDWALIYGQGYKDAQRGYDKRDHTKTLGSDAQEEYLRGYQQGEFDASRMEK